MRISNELQKGKVGEYLVCADLILKGFIAYPSEQGLPYDVVLDNGKKLIKVQVKTTGKPREVLQRKKSTYAYIFNIKRHGRNNIKRYSYDEVDIFALVCLDTNQIGYLLQDEMPDTINFRVDKLKGSYYDEKGIQNYQKVIELKKEYPKLIQDDIAKKVGIDQSVVNKMLKKDYKPFKTNARYFSEIIRNYKYFYGI